MEFQSAKEITEYLKEAMALESSFFKQQEAKNEANKLLESLKPKMATLREPNKRVAAKPYYNPPKIIPLGGRKGTISFFLVLALVVAVFLIIFTSGDGDAKLTFVVTLISASPLGLLALREYIKGKNEEHQLVEVKASYDRTYQEDLEKYEKKQEENDALYQEELKAYQIDCQKAEEEYQHKMELFHHAEEAVAQLDAPLKETENNLDKLYNVDVIYSKYRNMVAICSFYEYFLSGRCTKLTGPDGAYNLYEAELRQNLIINKLDNIIEELDQIKANQYALYMELRSAKTVTEGISGDIKGILSELLTISETSHITAACSEAAAKNTEALKYLTLLDSVKQ